MPLARFSARAVLAAAALALVAVPFAFLLALTKARWAPLRTVDDGARDELHAFAAEHAWFVSVMKAVSAVGDGGVYWVVFGALAAWLAGRSLRRLSAFVVVTMLGSAVLNHAVKALVERSRPALPDPMVEAAGHSFPSGHAQSATVACLVLLLVFLPVVHGRPRVLAFAASGTYVALVGFSRVALGVHFVTDVVAGAVLGTAWVAATTALLGAWRREEGLPRVEPDRGLEPEHAGRLS